MDEGAANVLCHVVEARKVEVRFRPLRENGGSCLEELFALHDTTFVPAGKAELVVVLRAAGAHAHRALEERFVGVPIERALAGLLDTQTYHSDNHDLRQVKQVRSSAGVRSIRCPIGWRFGLLWFRALSQEGFLQFEEKAGRNEAHSDRGEIEAPLSDVCSD